MVFSKDFKGQVKISEVKACLDDLVNNVNKQIDLYNTSDYVKDINYNIGAPDLAPLNYTLSIGGLKKFLNAYNGCVVGCKAFNIGGQYAVTDGIMFLQDGCHRIPAQIIPSLQKTLEYSPSARIYKGQTPTGEARIYLGSDGQIYLKAGKYKAVKDGTVVDYELTTDTVCYFNIPTTYKNFGEALLSFTNNDTVPQELPSFDAYDPQGNGFLTVIQQVEQGLTWSGASYAKFDATEVSNPMKFRSQVYTLYGGTSAGTAWFDIYQCLFASFNDTVNIKSFSYNIIENWAFNSSDSFTIFGFLWEKDTNKLIAEGKGTVVKLAYDSSKRNASINFAKGVTLEKGKQYVFEILLQRVPRYYSEISVAATDFRMSPNCSLSCQAPSGSVQGTFDIRLDSDGSLMTIRYSEHPQADNGSFGTINWENGVVTSITAPEVSEVSALSEGDDISDWIYICDLNPNRDIALSNTPNLAVCNVEGMYITSQSKNVGLETIEERDITKNQFVSGVPRDAKGAKGGGSRQNVVFLLGEYVARSFQRAKRAAGGLAIYNKLFLPKGVPNPYRYEGNGSYGPNGQKVFDANVTRNS